MPAPRPKYGNGRYWGSPAPFDVIGRHQLSRVVKPATIPAVSSREKNLPTCR
jgi:hypothetical protein